MEQVECAKCACSLVNRDVKCVTFSAVSAERLAKGVRTGSSETQSSNPCHG